MARTFKEAAIAGIGATEFSKESGRSELQLAAASEGVKLELVSFSVDPEHDTPAVLTDYAKKYEADLSSWRFLTGEVEVWVARRVAKLSRHLPFPCVAVVDAAALTWAVWQRNPGVLG